MYAPRRTYYNEPDATSIENLIIIAKKQALNAFNYGMITLKQLSDFYLSVAAENITGDDDDE